MAVEISFRLVLVVFMVENFDFCILIILSLHFVSSGTQYILNMAHDLLHFLVEYLFSFIFAVTVLVIL